MKIKIKIEKKGALFMLWNIKWLWQSLCHQQKNGKLYIDKEYENETCI